MYKRDKGMKEGKQGNCFNMKEGGMESERNDDR
jgi:hypothetical protein